MIKSDIDVKVKSIEKRFTQAQLAEAIGTTGQYLNRIIKRQHGMVNNTFMQMLEKLGMILNGLCEENLNYNYTTD